MNILQTLQQVDRRYLYAMLLLAVCLPFFISRSIPVPISPDTRGLYEHIEALPENSFVLVGMDWSAGTKGENGAQSEAILRHLMRKRLRFAMLAFANAQASTLSEDIAQRLQKDYGYKEGENWCNFGFKTDQQNLLQAFIRDIPGSIGTDVHGTPIEKLPVMQGVHSGKDINFFVDITGTNTFNIYIQFLQGPAGVPMGAALTAVMAPEALTYLDSKQMIGLLNGLKGATEYEQLMNSPGAATRASNSSALAHLLIITFIILGNIAMVLERRQKQRSGHSASSHHSGQGGNR